MPGTEEDLLRRLEAGDKTLWPEGNVSGDRLGWLEVPRQMDREARELTRWAETIDEEVILLLGMGGSSLGPLVLSSIAAAFSSPSGRRLVVCDTTDPETIAAAPFEDSFIIVSSKSGTTLEPNVLFDYARTRQKDPGKYAVITDPGSPLVRSASALRVNRIFENRPDIGGRYSVLSYFGLIPAVLCGYDIEELVGRAMEIDRRESVARGIEMGEAALEGRDKATIVCGERERPFGLWVEQLIAESTGKSGRGIVPVPTGDDERGSDRHTVEVALESAHELGGAFFDFEIRTAIAGHILGIDPFSEPNVAESKANTNTVLADLPLPAIASEAPDALTPFLENEIRPGDYVSLQAYLPYGTENQLEALRQKIRDANDGIAVTVGYGPRFLHSTGQLHKGGPNSIIAVQLVAAEEREDLAIPGKPYGFATLIGAQAIGDAESLKSHGRRVIRIAVNEPSDLL